MTDNTDTIDEESNLEENRDIWLDILKKCIEEGNSTFERQFELSEQHRESSEKLLQANTVLLGLILTIASLLQGIEDFDLSPLLNLYTAGGFIFLLLSIGVAVLTYRPLDQVIGIGGNELIHIAIDNIDEMEMKDDTKQEMSDYQIIMNEIGDNNELPSDSQLGFYTWLTKHYGERIDENIATGVRKAFVTATAMLFFILELTFFSLGIIDGFIINIALPAFALISLFLIVIIWLSGVPGLLFDLYISDS